MRGAISLLFVLLVSACGGVASSAEAAGRYRANWDSREELVLNADYTFRRVRADGSTASGTWLLSAGAGDARVEMREVGRQGVSAPSIHRTLSGQVLIIMNHDESRAFVKVDG